METIGKESGHEIEKAQVRRKRSTEMATQSGLGGKDDRNV